MSPSSETADNVYYVKLKVTSSQVETAFRSAPLLLARGQGFETFADYLDAVERRGVTLNYGCYVGHTAVACSPWGPEAYVRAATGEELVAP